MRRAPKARLVYCLSAEVALAVSVKPCIAGTSHSAPQLGLPLGQADGLLAFIDSNGGLRHLGIRVANLPRREIRHEPESITCQCGCGVRPLQVAVEHAKLQLRWSMLRAGVDEGICSARTLATV